MTEFQREWAKKNRNPKSPFSWVVTLVYNLQLAAAVGMNVAAKVGGVPEWVETAATGLAWSVVLTEVTLTVILLGIVTMLGISVAVWADGVKAKDTSRRGMYKTVKGIVAGQMLREMTAWGVCKFIGKLAVAAVLMATGCYVSGGTLFLATFLIAAIGIIYWAIVVGCSADLITPENVRWCEEESLVTVSK